MARRQDGAEQDVKVGDAAIARLLGALKPKGVWVKRMEDGSGGSVPGYGLWGAKKKANGEQFAIALVAHCLSEGLLCGSGGTYRLSREGAAWLRRQEGGQDRFRAQHQLHVSVQREVSPGVKRPVRVNEAETPLGWLAKRKDSKGVPLISAGQFKAGERLERDFWLAQLSPRVTADWGAVNSSKRMRRAAPGSGAEQSLDALAAKERFFKALSSVGPELSGILVDVCCHMQGLEAAERDHGWPQRSAKVVLQLALTRLARHYGLVSDGDVRRPGAAAHRALGGGGLSSGD